MNPNDAFLEPGTLLILGNGGHASVVADVAKQVGWTIIGCVDDGSCPPQHQSLHSLGSFDRLEDIVSRARADHDDLFVHAAVGDGLLREQWLDRVPRECVTSIIDDSAVVSPLAAIGPGTFIGPHAIVNAHAVLSRGCIVNSGAIVEHHCELGAFVHIAPGSTLGGNVRIGPGTLVGIGASVKPCVVLGTDVTVGVGAAVVSDAEDGATIVGVPGAPLVVDQP